MATTNFIDGQTTVVADWLNDVDAVVYGIGSTTPGEGAGLVSLEDGRDVQSAIEVAETDINTLQTDVDTTEADIVQLETSVAALQAVNGNKNRLLNSAFRLNQRAVSGTVILAAGAYGHDMWKAGSGGCTYTFATVSGEVVITITAGTLVQVIEGINIQTTSYCLSWSGTAQGRFNLAGGYAASGITTTGTAGTNLSVEFNTGTLYNVQCERGTVPTGYDLITVAEEILLCSRYGQFAQFGYYDLTTSASSRYVYVQLRSPMRAVPTLGTPTTIATETNVSSCVVIAVNASTIRGEFIPTASGAVLGARQVFLSAGL